MRNNAPNLSAFTIGALANEKGMKRHEKGIKGTEKA